MKILLLALTAALAACTSQQSYQAAQGWQMNQCERYPGKDDRDRCMSRAGGSYDDYKRDTGAR